jgi:hypothetical protein
VTAFLSPQSHDRTQPEANAKATAIQPARPRRIGRRIAHAASGYKNSCQHNAAVR